MNDKVKDLYDFLTNEGYDFMGSEDDFRGKLKDGAKAGELYSFLTNEGYDFMGSYDEFISKVGAPYNTAAANRAAGVGEESNRAQKAQQPTQRNMGTPGYVPNRFGLPIQQQPITPMQGATPQYVTQQGQGETYTPSARVKTPTAKRPKPMAPAPRAGQWSGAPMQQTPYAPTEDEGNKSFMPIEQETDTKARYDAQRNAVGGQGGQVETMRSDIDSRLQEAYQRDLDNYGSELDKGGFWARMGRSMQAAEGNNPAANAVPSQLSDDTRDYQAAKHALDNSQKIIDEANAASRNGNFFAGAGRGMRDKFFDVSTWDFGITDLTDQAAIMRALEAYDKGEQLTDSQQALLDAKAVELATTAYFGSELGRGYKAGQVTAEAIPFMFEMAINPAAGVGKGASKAMVRYALKKFGKEAIEKGGKRFAAKQAMKYGTRIVGDVVGASGMAATTGAARTAADALDRMAGNLHYDTDEQGNITFDGHTDAESVMKAFGKAFASTTIENYSEMLGNYFGPALGLLGKGAGKIGKGLSQTKVADFIRKINAGTTAQFLTELESRAQWHGVMGEYAEEVAGGILNALVVGDQTLDTDKDTGVFNLDNNIDTFLGVALMGGFFSGAKTVGYGVERAHNARQYNKANRMGASAFGDGWADVQAAIESDPKAGAVAVLIDPNATREQKVAALKYAEAVTARQGMVQGKAKRDAEGVQTMQEAAAEQSYNTGYDDANTDELRSDINMAYTDARQTLVGLIGEDAVNDIDSDPLAMQAKYDQDMTVDDNTKFAVASYVSAKSAWDGVQQRISDDAADRADQRRAEGERMAYKGKGDMQGAIRPLTINEESREEVVNPQTGEKERKKKVVYLVNGNIAIEPNGNGLSREGTDKTIYVYDPETGDTHELDPFAGAGVLEVGEPVSMEDYLANNEQQSQAEVQQAAETAQGKVKVNTPFETPQGRKGVVQSIEGDNAIVLFADGEMEQASMPLAEVQQYADALRRQEYEARHPQTPAEQPQQPNTATEGQAPKAEQTTPQEGNNADTRTPAQRTYDDVVAKLGADRASKKIDATAKVKADRLKKAEKALKTAQETADNTEYGSKEEQKAEEAVVNAQAEYDAAQQDMAAWDEVRKLRDQALLAQSEAEDAARKAELERKRAAETEAQRKQREEYEDEQARRREQAERVRQEDAERLKAQIEQEKQEQSNPQPNEPAAPIEGTKGSRSQLEIAREEMADNPEALAMLDDLEPRSLDEIAATLLGGGKRSVKLQREEFKRHTGYSEGEIKRYPFIFASKENGGVTIERLGEMVANEAVNENIPFDELDAMAGTNAVLDMLSSVYSQGDINNYIQNKRIAEAREYYNKVKSEAYAMMLDAYGMTEGEYEAYMSWLEDAAEQRQNTLTDEQALELINQAIQQDNERQAETNAGNSEQQSTETTERTESAETDVSQNGERGNGETDAGTEQPAVNTEQNPSPTGQTEGTAEGENGNVISYDPEESKWQGIPNDVKVKTKHTAKMDIGTIDEYKGIVLSYDKVNGNVNVDVQVPHMTNLERRDEIADEILYKLNNEGYSVNYDIYGVEVETWEDALKAFNRIKELTTPKQQEAPATAQQPTFEEIAAENARKAEEESKTLFAETNVGDVFENKKKRLTLTITQKGDNVIHAEYRKKRTGKSDNVQDVKFDPLQFRNYVEYEKLGKAAQSETSTGQPNTAEQPTITTEPTQTQVADIDNPETWVGHTFAVDGMRLKCKSADNNYSTFDNETAMMGQGFPTDTFKSWWRDGRVQEIGTTAEQSKQETKQEQPKAETTQEPKRLISDEQMDELKERLRKKLRGQLNSGFDPEIIEIGLYLAVGHIERGLTKFADFAKRMIEDLGDAIRPYLKSFYNGARDFPGAEKLAEQMTPYDEVRAFDVENFDKARPSSIIDTAKEIAAEQEIEKEVEKIKKPTKGNKKEDSTLSNTEQGQLDLFGTQTTNNNDNGLERPNAVRTEGGTRGQHADSTESSVRTNGERTPQESGGTDGSGESGSVGALGQELQHGLRPNDELAEKRNTRNNHAERGKDYAPKDVDARIEANIAAIERMQQLRDAEKQATPADMAVLRKFSGWGGLGKAFDNYEYSTKLKALLGEEAYEQANLSRYSAFYTPAKITDTLWDIARALGFKGGKVLEGSAGIGNILGAMPTDMSEQSSIEAVEIDPTTGGILSLLYPDAKVNIKGFEETRVPNGSVDLAITNVPFVADMKVPKDETGDADLSSKFKRSIQDFCIAKNVRKLKEGGIGIFITSSGTLDNSEKLRNWLTNEGNADVVGAYRMHKNTFGGASVTTDIIVIRKRVNKQKSAHAIDVSGTTAVRTAKYTHSEWDDKKKDIVEKTDELTMDYNTYFVEHPEMMGGEMKFAFEKGDTYRPTSRALFPKNGVNQDNGLKEFVQSLSGKEWDNASDKTASDTVEYKELGEGITEGSMFVGEDGGFYVAQQGLAVPLEINTNKVKGHTKQECFEAYTAIKDAVSEVLDYETKNVGDEGLQPLLDKLNKAYDDFVSTYGHFQKNPSIAFLRNDMGFSNVRALETMTEYNDEQGNRQQRFKKGDIFSKRVVEKEAEPKPTNAKDGVIASMYKYGRIDIPYISKQIGKSEEEVKNEILESGIGFENPQSREVEVTYEYLSGNVREKLRQAQEANENGEFDRNIKALQDIIPMNIPAHLIEFSIGSSWLDPKLYSDYISDRTGINVEMTYFNGMWMPSKVNDWNADTEKNREMSISSDIVDKTVWGHEMIIAAMQNRTIEMKKVVRDRVTKTKETIADPEATRAIAAKIDEIRADFKDWARAKMQSDPALSEIIEEEYNERFNNFVPKSIPNDFVPEYFGGASRTIKLQPHQAKAAIRATTQPLMIAHEVGAGKTFTLITAAMEMRRIGTARKPMIVVQNATVGQFVESAKTLYPNAKILTLEDAEHNKGGRLAFYSMIKYNDWDMIIVPQSTFNMIPDSEDRKIAYIKEKIEEKEAALDRLQEIEGNETIIDEAEKEIEKMAAELEKIMQEKADKKKKRDQKRDAMVKKNAATQAKEALDRYVDDVEDFDQMGIDAILVDEAHNYKRLGFATAMRRGVKGIDPAYSKKAQSVFLKAQSVMERTGGKNVIFATGTPISNTAAEIWTFMRYLMPAETLREYDIYYFDDFVRNFGNLTQMLEFSTDGKFKENNRFAGYINMPELARIWSGVADTKLTDDIERERLERGEESKIPDMEGGKATDIYLPQTRALRSVILYVKQTLKEFDNMKPKEKKKNRHIPLVMYGIASRAAVDVRLVLNNGGEVVGHETGGQSVSSGADEPNSKTNEAVRQTLRSLEETKDYKGTVAIFADLYQNKETGFNLYEEIKRKLVEAGVPEEQIAIMKSGMTMKKKLGILDKVNAGEIRVIMGSTATLGTGVNIQERLHTLIHMDAPNRPMDYTQRNGRILRQGNIHKQMGKPVRILRFGVEDSLDVTAYQRLKTKGAIADSVMRSGQLIANSMENRTMEEVEDLFGDAVAQLSGSEYAMLKQQAEREVRKYEAKRKQYESDQTYIHNQKPRLKGQIESAKQRAAEAQAALSKIENAKGEKDIVIGKNTFANVAAMADFFKEYNKKVNEDSERVRKSYMQEKAWRDLTMNIGGFDFNVHLEIEKSYETKGGSMTSVAKRTMTYSCEALGLKDVPVRQGLLRNAVEDIVNDVLTGNDFRERIEAAERGIARNEEALEQMSKREGKPFEFSKELEEAKQRYEEYEQLMKAEMEAKEEKYAEMDAETTAIDASALSNIEDEDEEEDEDTDSDVRFRSSTELFEQYPTWLSGQTTSTGQHTTQITSTVKTYQRIGDWMQSQGMEGAKVLDASSGLGAGTQALRDMGFDVEDVEPYPSENREAPTYTRYEDVNGKYDVVISNAVLNVIPDDWRADVLRSMADKVKEGGKLIINVRDAKSIESQKQKIELDSPSEILVTDSKGNIRAYQKGFTKSELKAYVESELGEGWQVEIANEGNSGVKSGTAVVVTRGEGAEVPNYRKPADMMREGGEEAAQGEWYDRNSVERIGEFAGYTPKQIAKMNARQEQSARKQFNDTAEKLHLADNITFADTIDDVPGLTDEQRKEWRRKKGWYSQRTGKIVIILGNHKSMDDVMKSILHEGVAHHGLRQMFGEHFNTFLDNVYQNAHESIRDEINAMAKKHGWNFREATEEYLAKLAEDTDFEKPQNQLWWGQVKQWFFDMLHKIGFKLHDAYDTITDNELRYILWRSYQNLVNPGRFNSVVEEAKDIAKQYDLKVGQWDETWTAAEAEPNATMEYNGRKIPVWAGNGRREDSSREKRKINKPIYKPGIKLNEIEKIETEAENDGYVEGVGIRMTMTDGQVYRLWVCTDKEEGDYYETTEFYPQGEDEDIPEEEMTERFGDFFGENVNKIFGSIIGSYIMTSGRRGFTLSHDDIMRMGSVRSDRTDRDDRDDRDEIGNRTERETKTPAEIMAKIQQTYPDMVFLVKRGKSYLVSGEGAKAESVKTMTKNEPFMIDDIENFQNYLSRQGIDSMVIDTAADGVAEDGIRFRDGEDEETDSEERESIEQLANDRSIGTSARFAAVAARNAQESHDNAEALAAALNFTSQNLAEIVEATKAQKKFDKATVKQVTDMARVMVSAGYLDSMGRADVKGLLKAIRESTGETDNTDNVNRIIDIMVKNQLKNQENTLATLLKIKGSRVDARGINVQGKLDPNGQQVIKSFKDNMKEQRETIESRIADAEERMTSEDKAIADAAYNEKVGLQLALDYVDKIGQSKADEKDIEAKKRAELSKVYDYTRVVDVDEQGNALFKKDGTERTHEVRHVRAEYKGKISDEKKAERERVEQTAAAMDDAIRHMRMERIDAYTDFIAQVAGNMKESMERAKAFKEADRRRVERIHHLANSEMQGRKLKGQDKDTILDNLSNNVGVRIALSPLMNLDQMLRMFGRQNVDGKGNLWNYYMRGWIDAVDGEQTWKERYMDKLNAKVKELFGKHGYNWLEHYSNTKDGMTVQYWDGTKMKEVEMPQSRMLYIYAVEKMPMGKATNRRMGLTDEDIAIIEDRLDPKLKEFVDWVQRELLPEMGRECDKVHMRMFGAHMDSIENYFPFDRDTNAMPREEENGQERKNNKITVLTGAIKKRTPNVVVWDMKSCNIFDVLTRHIEEMSHWANFAELNRDFGTLESYNRFKQQVMAMDTVYGSGKNLWNNFMEVCAIATDAYDPQRGEFDKNASLVLKGVAMGKVALRPFTAIKQILSQPAFWGEANPIYMIEDLASLGLIPWYKGQKSNRENCFLWAWNNMPNFRKRVVSRTTGNFYLQDTEYDKQKLMGKIMEKTKWGMLPNIAVDAWTIAMGSHAVYRTSKDKYIRQGFGERKAERRAIQDAELCFNKSQQSSEGAFMAPMQIDHTVTAGTAMIFRNASTSYTREWLASGRQLKRLVSGEVNAEAMAKQILRARNSAYLDGEISSEELQKVMPLAKRELRTGIVRQSVNHIMFGWVLPWFWRIGGLLPLFLLSGDDDEKKKRWEEAKKQSLFGPVEGFLFGDVQSDVINKLVGFTDKDWEYIGRQNPTLEDLGRIKKELGYDPTAAITDALGLLVGMCSGINPQTIVDWATAIVDKTGGDRALAREGALFAARLLNCPPSQLEQIYFDEIEMTGTEASNYTIDELVDRWAEYKTRNSHMGLMPEEALEKTKKRGYKIIEEKVGKMSDEALAEMYDRSGITGKARVGKVAADRLSEEYGMDLEDSFGRGNAINTKYGKIYAQHRTYIDMAEDITLNAEIKRLTSEKERLESIGAYGKLYNETIKKLEDLKDVKNTEIPSYKRSMVNGLGNPMSEEVINTQMENIRKARRRALYPEQAANPTDNVEE